MNIKEKIRRSRILFFLLFAELLVIIAGFFWLRHNIQRITPIDVSITDWTCRHSVYHDGAFSVEEDDLNSGNEIVFLYGPGISLKKGTYAAIIEYESEFDQTCMASGTNAVNLLIIPADFIKASPGILSSSKDSITYRFEVPEDVKNFNLSVNYNGKGTFQVKRISIQQTGTYYKRTLASLVLISILIDAVYLAAKCPVKTKKEIGLVFAIGLAVSIPLFFRQAGELNTADTQFHQIRIEILANAIRDRQFPPRISSLWMDGYGFAASIFYNDILLIFPALLRLLGYDLVFSLKAYLLCVNLLTAAVSVWAFSRIFDDKKIGILAAVSYVCAPFRLGDIYAQSAVGEFTAMMFLPMIAYGIVKMYTEDPEDWKKYHRYGLVLTLGITGVAASHTLSLVLTVFFMFFVFLILFKKSFRKNTLRLWVDTAILSLLLSAYFLVPFFDYYVNVETLIKENAAVGGAAMMQYYGAGLGRLFAFFPDAFDPADYRVLTPGLLLTLAFGLGCYRVYKNRNSRLMLYLVLSAAAVVLSTDFFPWNFLEAHTFFGRTLAMIQYPWRFLIIADLLLCLVLGEVCREFMTEESSYLSDKTDKAVLLLNFIFLVFFISNFSTGFPASPKYETASLDTFLTSLHYLPVGASTDRYAYKNNIISSGVEEASVISRKTHTTEIYARSRDGGMLEIPILNYPYYHVSDASGNEFPIRSGTNCRICFDIPAGFDGVLSVEFREPVYWRAAIGISIFSMFLMPAVSILKRGKKEI